MKKVFSVLTVAVLAVSTVFAGFGGKASIGAGANFDNGNFGFLSQKSGVNIDVELSTAEGEKVGEGEVYASIKGSMELVYLGGFGQSIDHGRTSNFGINAAVTEAKVGGENWSVSILSMPDAPDYAKSGVDFYPEGKKDAWGREQPGVNWKPVTYKAPYAKTNGVTVDVAGYKVGLGLLGDFAKNVEFKNQFINIAAVAETPEYDFNGFTFQVGASYARTKFEKLYKGAPSWTVDNPDTDKDEAWYPTHGMGISAKAGYANDAFSVAVASDMGINFLKDNEFNADVAVDVAYNFVSAAAYYNSARKNLVSFGVDFDLNSIEVPVVLSVSAKDLVNEQALGLAVETTPVEGLTISAYGDYAIASKGWDAGIGAEYEHEMFTVAGGIDLAKAPEKVQLAANASVESDALVNGATLGLSWEANDLLNVVADADDDGVNYGSLTASCTIKF